MSGLDVSRLTASDCVAALRSYPRRFRAAIATIGDDEPVDTTEAAAIADQTASTIAAAADAMRRVLTVDAPVLSALAATLRTPASTEAALDHLTLECDALADAIERVDVDDWARTATASDGRTITALDVGREAVKVGADGLHAAEASLRR